MDRSGNYYGTLHVRRQFSKGRGIRQLSSRFYSRATHARTLLPAALASVPFGFVFIRDRVFGSLKRLWLAFQS
jgi:hypothetical protein